MSKYLIFSGGVLCGVLLVVVAVFVYIQIMLKPAGDSVVATSTPPATVSTVEATASPKNSTTYAAAKPNAVADDTGPLLLEPIPLSRLPLSDTQKQLVSSLGIDYDTFMITPEMATCAEGRLGRDRVKELIAGAAPTFSEMTALARCM